MNLKNFLFDRRFSLNTWFHTLMCLSMSVTALILLSILWGIGNSVSQFLDIIKSEISRTILFSILFTVFLNGFILIRLNSIIHYLSSPPNNSFANFKEVRQEAQRTEYLAKYRYSFLILFVVFVGFCVGFFIGGNEWTIALQLPAKIALSVSVAILTASFFRIIIEAILLGLRYLIQ